MNNQHEVLRNSDSELLHSQLNGNISSDIIQLDSNVDFPVIFERSPENRRTNRYRNDRVIEKIGYPNVLSIKNISRSKSVRFVKDLVNTIIDSRWRFTLFTFVLTYFFNWLLFASLWMFLGNWHNESINESTQCFTETDTFMGFFLLAVETQTTIGFGVRSVTDNCPDAIFLLCLQMLFTICINGAFISAVYAKMIRPLKCGRTRFFSKKAVITQRDGKLCFMFRVWDINHSHIIGTQIHAYFINKNYITREQETLRNYFIEMKLEPFGLLLWPLTIVHVIDATSPLYKMSAQDLLTKRFEIAVVLTGSSESTSQLSQLRTSYLSTEILWGHRIVSCVTFNDHKQSYCIEKNNFHKTKSVNTVLCSAEHLDRIQHLFIAESVC